MPFFAACWRTVSAMAVSSVSLPLFRQFLAFAGEKCLALLVQFEDFALDFRAFLGLRLDFCLRGPAASSFRNSSGNSAIRAPWRGRNPSPWRHPPNPSRHCGILLLALVTARCIAAPAGVSATALASWATWLAAPRAARRAVGDIGLVQRLVQLHDLVILRGLDVHHRLVAVDDEEFPVGQLRAFFPAAIRCPRSRCRNGWYSPPRRGSPPPCRLLAVHRPLGERLVAGDEDGLVGFGRGIHARSSTARVITAPQYSVPPLVPSANNSSLTLSRSRVNGWMRRIQCDSGSAVLAVFIKRDLDHRGTPVLFGGDERVDHLPQLGFRLFYQAAPCCRWCRAGWQFARAGPGPLPAAGAGGADGAGGTSCARMAGMTRVAAAAMATARMRFSVCLFMVGFLLSGFLVLAGCVALRVCFYGCGKVCRRLRRRCRRAGRARTAGCWRRGGPPCGRTPASRSRVP